MNGDHEIEHAAAGRPIEYADARSQPARAALRNAPAWVHEKIARLHDDHGETAVVEHRGGVEYAHEDRATAAVERSLRHAPAHIVRRINEHRRRSGLPEIRIARPEPTGPGVWVVDKRTGRLVPATAARMIGTTSRPPARPTTPRATPLAAVVDRVLILPCPSFSDAPARNLGSALPETITPTAFGRADDLNRERSFNLQMGHHGPKLAYAGQALRAIDTPHGIAFEWIVDKRMPLAADALRAIERSGAVSVALKIHESRTMRLPFPTNAVTRATLYHIAILDEDRPAYPAAVAMRFPGSRQGNADELRKQIDKVVAEARFRSWRTSR